MKKKLLFKSLILFLTFHTNCQVPMDSMDNGIIKMLEKNDLNIQLFELAFALPELAYIIENDTTDLFEKRIQNAFRENLPHDTKYIHSLSLKFLISRFRLNQEIALSFPLAFQKVIMKDSILINQPNKEFHEIYKSYIKYPEQVDAITIITLLEVENCEIYNSIENDELALYYFNSWLEYGFDEFRYYPDSENPSKKLINDRIVNWVTEHSNCPENNLVHKAKIMMRETIESY
ncbi:MAG: hypothetical protein RLQ12_13420 [Cyclobacteriaceae bacterium]